ncbi:MAG: hypothetical protein WAX14_01765 [Rhodococcus sp. (in: high G+C Gram-positive bacteria)]|uniref:hypothetical protein n=1 Tax=Rhodococcus sp. TaxID=1831 RepID=UPI003BB48B64
MTEKKPDTGQISVAELLARNGKSVDSRAGGRRRRGTSGGISVAELTGEIPIIPAAEQPPAEPVAEVTEVEPPEPDSPQPESPEQELLEPESPTPEIREFEIQQPEPPKFELPKPEVSTAAAPASEPAKRHVPDPAPTVVTSPDPVTPDPVTPDPTADAPTTADGAKIESPTEVIRMSALPRRARAHLETTGTSAAVVAPAAPVLPRPADGPEPRLLSGPASDLRGTGSDDADSFDDTDLIAGTAGADPKKPNTPANGTVSATSGSTDAHTGAESKNTTGASGRRRRKGGKNRDDTAPDDTPRAGKNHDGTDAEVDGAENADPEGAGDDRAGGLRQWAMLAGESLAAIVAGALLFKGFERLWDLLPWVAFALALLVIVGLVAVVRILRRTDDITSQLIALAVGAFVTFGPLLFLLPNG